MIATRNLLCVHLQPARRRTRPRLWPAPAPARPAADPSPAEGQAPAEGAESLTHLPARHFDPTPGRWLQEEPLGFAPGDAGLCPFPPAPDPATTDGPSDD
jgi:hypothetical protein